MPTTFDPYMLVPTSISWEVIFGGIAVNVFVFEFILGRKIERPVPKTLLQVAFIFILILIALSPVTAALFWGTVICLTTVGLRAVWWAFEQQKKLKESASEQIRLSQEIQALQVQVNTLVKEKLHLDSARSSLEAEVRELNSKLEGLRDYQENYNREDEFRLIGEQVQMMVDHMQGSPNYLSVEQSLNHVLDRMMTTVLYTPKPNRFRVCIAEPAQLGQFRVLASRNTLFERIIEIQREANWEKGISLFASGVHSTSPLVETSASPKHFDFEVPYSGYRPSQIHLIIPIVNERYMKAGVLKRCLAVITIGALDIDLLINHAQVLESLEPHLYGIKQILICHRDVTRSYIDS